MNMMKRWNVDDGLLPAAWGGLNGLFRSVFDQITDFGPEWMSDRAGGKSLDLKVEEKEITATLPMPGCNDEDIEVEVNGDILSIRAERSEEKKEENKETHFIRRERSTMSFEESVRLPVKVKAGEAKAKYEDGVLTVTLPREKAAAEKTHVVKVK